MSPNHSVNDSTSRSKQAGRLLLGAVLVYAGVAHLTTRRIEFQAQVPAWVPVDENVVVILSGVVEIALGAMLLVLAKHKAIVGLMVAAFFIAVFPGNIAQYVEHKDAFGLDSDTARFVRLLFQPTLVAWALWSTDAWPVVMRALRRR
jgi:uncharacterized membrane protein